MAGEAAWRSCVAGWGAWGYGLQGTWAAAQPAGPRVAERWPQTSVMAQVEEEELGLLWCWPVEAESAAEERTLEKERRMNPAVPGLRPTPAPPHQEWHPGLPKLMTTMMAGAVRLGNSLLQPVLPRSSQQQQQQQQQTVLSLA